ncbi:MAG: succinate dehydrogenase [Pyrobaculum sp.]
MRGSVERLVLIIGAFIMVVGMPAVIFAAVALGKIPLEDMLNTHPLVIIPYAFVKIGWGLLWAIVAVDWVVHGSHGMRRVLGELIKSERGRKVLDLLINVVMAITSVVMFYVLIFIPN